MTLKEHIERIEEIIQGGLTFPDDVSPLDVQRIERIAVNLRRSSDEYMKEVRKRDKV